MADANVQVTFGADASALQSSLAGVKSALDGLTSGLAGLQASFAGMASSISQQAGAMSQLATAMQAVGASAKGAEGGTSGFSKGLDEVFKFVDRFNSLVEFGKNVGSLGDKLETATGKLTKFVAGLFGVDIAMEANPLGAWVLLFTAIAAAVVAATLELKHLYDTNETVKAGFDAVGGIFVGVGEILRGVWDIIMAGVEVEAHLVEGFVSFIGLGLQLYLDDLRTKWDAFKTAVELVWGVLKHVVEVVAAFIEKNFGPVIDVVTTAWNNLRKAVEDVAQMVLGELKKAFDWWSTKASELLGLVGHFLDLHFHDVIASWSTALGEFAKGFDDVAAAAGRLWSVLTGHHAPAPSGNGPQSKPNPKPKHDANATTDDQADAADGDPHHRASNSPGRSPGAAPAKTEDCGQEAADCEAKALQAKLDADQQKLASDKATQAAEDADYDQYLADLATKYGKDSDQYRAALQQKEDYDRQFTNAGAQNAVTLTAAQQASDSADVKNHADALAKKAADDKKAADQFKKTWDSVVDPLVAKFTSGIVQMIQGTKSFASVMADIGKQILNDFVTRVINPLIERWLFAQTKNIAATVMGWIGINTAHAAGEATGKAISAAANVSENTKNANMAASGAYKAVSGIIPIGPFIAPGVAAGVFAAVEGLSVAEGGFDIPSGLNPITQLHQNEMVLPATLAMPMRAMLANFQAANFNGPPAANDGGGDTHLHMHVQAMDAQSFRGFLRNNSDHLSTVLQEMGRRGMKTG